MMANSGMLTTFEVKPTADHRAVPRVTNKAQIHRQKIQMSQERVQLKNRWKNADTSTFGLSKWLLSLG